MAYDGSLVFNTELNTDGFENSLNSLTSLSGSLAVVSELSNKLLSLSGAANKAFASLAQVQLHGFNTASIFGNINAETLVAPLQTAINTAVGVVSAQSLASAAGIGNAIVTGAASGVQANPMLASALTANVVNAANAAGASAASAGFYSVGIQMVQGIATGIHAGASSVTSAMVNVISSAVNAAKSAAQIHSPSRIFDVQVGRMLMKGIESGVLNGAKDVQSTMEQSLYGIVKNAKKYSQKIMLADSAMGGIAKLNSASANNSIQNLAINNAFKAGATGLINLMQSSVLNNAKRLANASFVNNSTKSLAQNGQNGAGVTNLYMTVNTHDSLSESELTRQAEDFLTRTRRKLP